MKKFILALLMLSLVLPMSGCYDSRNIEETAFVLAVGIDSGKGDLSTYTFQFAKPDVFAGKSEGGSPQPQEGGNQSTGVENITIMAPTFYTALDLINNNYAKKPELSQMKMVVFSADAARNGVQENLNTMLYSKDFSPNINVIVSGCDAKEYLDNINPPLDANPARYYEMIFSNMYTVFSPLAYLQDFAYRADNHESVLLTPYVDVSDTEKIGDLSDNYSSGDSVNPHFKAGEGDKISGMKGEIMGAAVFKNGVLEQVLNANDAFNYALLSGQMANNYYAIRDSADPSRFHVIYLKTARQPSLKADLDVSPPQLSVTAYVTWQYITTQSTAGYTDRAALEQQLGDALIADAKDFMVRTQSNGLDVLGFRSIAKRRYLTIDHWLQEDWTGIYKNAVLQTNINLTMVNSGSEPE